MKFSLVRAIVIASTLLATPVLAGDPPVPGIYVQRGVAPMEASRGLFASPTGRIGMGAYNYNPANNGLPAGFMYSTQDDPLGMLGGAASEESMRDMMFYARTGTQKQSFFELKGYHDTSDIAHCYHEGARGYIQTYRSDAVSGAYTGSVRGNVVLLRPDAQVWGITPAPLGINEAGEAIYAWGDMSVFGPANPLSRAFPQAAAGRPFVGGVRSLSPMSLAKPPSPLLSVAGRAGNVAFAAFMIWVQTEMDRPTSLHYAGEQNRLRGQRALAIAQAAPITKDPSGLLFEGDICGEAHPDYFGKLMPAGATIFGKTVIPMTDPRHPGHHLLPPRATTAPAATRASTNPGPPRQRRAALPWPLGNGQWFTFVNPLR